MAREPDRTHDQPASPAEPGPQAWRVAAVVDSRLEADLVVHLLRGHGLMARSTVHSDGTADILVPETSASAARETLRAV